MENIILNNDMNNDMNNDAINNINPFININTKLIKLLDDINSELFYNYTQCDYMEIAWGIYGIYENIDIILENLQPVHILVKKIKTKLKEKKKEKESVYKVLYEYVINNISSQKITYSEGGKTIFQYPQLERQSNWPYYLYNSASLVLDLSEYRNILRSILFLQCKFIEDLIEKKKAVYYENIKLELTLRKSKKYYKALIIFIQVNRLYLINYDKKIKTFLKNIDLSILNIKDKNYFIHEAWWLTGRGHRLIRSGI
jgi:hypothetical protein